MTEKPCPFCGAPTKPYGTDSIACTDTLECGARIDNGRWTGPIEPVVDERGQVREWERLKRD